MESWEDRYLKLTWNHHTKYIGVGVLSVNHILVSVSMYEGDYISAIHNIRE